MVLGSPPTRSTSFGSVLLHEFLHGLGFRLLQIAQRVCSFGVSSVTTAPLRTPPQEPGHSDRCGACGLSLNTGHLIEWPAGTLTLLVSYCGERCRWATLYLPRIRSTVSSFSHGIEALRQRDEPTSQQRSQCRPRDLTPHYLTTCCPTVRPTPTPIPTPTPNSPAKRQ